MTPEERLERIGAWARVTPGVHAALVVGSRARTDVPADVHSDSDVVLICDDPQQWLRSTDWLAEFGTPRVRRMLLATSSETLAIDRQLPTVRAIGTPKRASGVAIRKSQAVAIASPPPTAWPSTNAIVGIGSVASASIAASMRRS